MNKEKIKCEIVDWRITSACNSNCDFCYASAKIKSADKKSKDIIVNKIIQSGCKAVCISGGEPLLDPDVIDVIDKLHKSHIEIYLSTNGTEYMKYRRKLETKISKLSLSLDGYDRSSHSLSGRVADSFDSVIKILKYYNEHPHKFAIKIGTLLSNKNMNMDHFQKMFDLLCGYDIDQWKIYEFIPEGRGCINQNEFLPSSDAKNEFLKQFQHLQTKIQGLGMFQCLVVEREMRNSAYFIIRPDGKVIIPQEETKGVEEVVVGDLVSNSLEAVLEKWRDKIDSIKYITNLDSRSILKVSRRSAFDEVDKRILYLLDFDPLQELTQLKASLKRDFDIDLGLQVLKEKIGQLFGKGALYRIMPVVNVANFGLSVYLLNLCFVQSKYMDAEKIGQILASKPYIAWVVQCREYNKMDDYLIFRISIFAKDIPSLKRYESTLKEDFGPLLSSMEVDLVPDKDILKQTYLLDDTDKIDSKISTANSHIELETNKESLSQEEYNILEAMNQTDHLSIADISFYTNISENRVRKIIDNLLEKKIINKFDVVLNANVMGYYVYLVMVKFSDEESKKTFREYITSIPNATHINTLVNGKWDMDIEFRVGQISTWANIWKGIEKKFGDKITEKKLIRIEKEYSFKFLIGATLESMKQSVKPTPSAPAPAKQLYDNRLRRK